MRKENIVELVGQYHQEDSCSADREPHDNDNLETAINKLIYRLRSLGPITDKNP